MSLDLNTSPALVIPETPLRARRRWLLLAIVLAPALGLLAVGSQIRASWTRMNAPVALATLAVDEGDIELIVVENGSLESANNATARCQVEALIGTVGGAQAGAGSGQQGAATSGVKKPSIRSFSYAIAPYVPLRPKSPPAQQPKAVVLDQGGGGGGRGGGGGGGGGRRGGGGGRRRRRPVAREARLDPDHLHPSRRNPRQAGGHGLRTRFRRLPR